MNLPKFLPAFGLAASMVAYSIGGISGVVAAPVSSFGDATEFTSATTLSPPAILPVGGTGIGNGGFALVTDTVSGFQLGLRAGERFFSDFLPNDGVGTYFADPGPSPTSGIDPTPVPGLASWNFYLHIDLGSGLGSAPLTHSGDVAAVILEMDFDPGVGVTDFLTFDILSASAASVAATPGDLRLVQLSSNLGFSFWQGAPFFAPQVFDENAEGEYTFRLTALDSSSDELGSVEVNVIVGNPALAVDVSEPMSIALFGLGLAGLGYMRRRRAC